MVVFMYDLQGKKDGLENTSFSVTTYNFLNTGSPSLFSLIPRASDRKSAS